MESSKPNFGISQASAWWPRELFPNFAYLNIIFDLFGVHPEVYALLVQKSLVIGGHGVDGLTCKLLAARDDGVGRRLIVCLHRRLIAHRKVCREVVGRKSLTHEVALVATGRRRCSWAA